MVTGSSTSLHTRQLWDGLSSRNPPLPKLTPPPDLTNPTSQILRLVLTGSESSLESIDLSLRWPMYFTELSDHSGEIRASPSAPRTVDLYSGEDPSPQHVIVMSPLRCTLPSQDPVVEPSLLLSPLPFSRRHTHPAAMNARRLERYDSSFVMGLQFLVLGLISPLKGYLLTRPISSAPLHRNFIASHLEDVINMVCSQPQPKCIGVCGQHPTLAQHITKSLKMFGLCCNGIQVASPPCLIDSLPVWSQDPRPLLPAETLQGSDHLVDFGLYAESSIVKFSFKAMTPPKICLKFDIFLVNCHNVFVIPPFPVTGSIVQECGLARFTCYYVTVASPSHYAVSSIDGSSHNRSYSFPTHIFVAKTIAVSIIDGSSQVRLCDHLTGAAIFYRVSWTTCYQNPLVGFFIVVFDFFALFRTRALGLQVKLLYGSLLSLATPISLYVLVIFIYQFIVEDLSSCIRLSPLGL
ncbi:BnaC06g11180D [Brassica napus]|uniref:BnaC06g11180D protein n=1 Tax=Brassica napus TaxID=3708 RepID=A0A078GN91_BRANA|nr:BnaC06g11180D [Brassica napus]